MLQLLNKFALWVDTNYEKIWLVMIAVTAILFMIGLLSGNEEIYGMSEDISDFYDEVFSE